MMAIGKKGPTVPNYFYVQDESGLGGNVWFGSRGGPSIDIEYSTDLENWTSEPAISPSTMLPLPIGGRLYIRGDNTRLATDYINGHRFLQCSVSHSVGGNVAFLLDTTGKPTAVDARCFAGFFGPTYIANTNLVDAHDLIIPESVHVVEAFRRMFYGCANLIKGPKIMIRQALLTREMQEMFYGCSSLNEVTCLTTNISASFATTSWMQGVGATGVFHKAAKMTSWPRNNNGIPSGWTVVDL